jgi:competence protein ComEC
VLFDPFLLEHVGALLSFFAIGGIFLFYRPFTLFFAHLFGVEPDIDHPHPQRFVFWRLIRYYFAATLAVSLAAWLSTLPLTLYFFQRLSLIGLVLNLFIPTLTIFIIWSGITSACLGFLCPWISIGLNRMSASLLEMIHLTATRASELPFTTLTIETTPHWLLIALLQGLIFVLGLILREKAIRRLQHRLGTLVKRL